MNLNKIFGVFIFIFLTGCTTTIGFKDLSKGQSQQPSLRGKKVAIVLDPAKIAESVTTTSEFETFEFKKMASAISESLKNQIDADAKLVEVLAGMPSVSDSGFDFYFVPFATARSVYDFWTYGCLMTYKLEILDKNRKLIVSANDQAKRNFAFTGQANGKCNEAMRDLVSSVNERTLSKLK